MKDTQRPTTPQAPPNLRLMHYIEGVRRIASRPKVERTAIEELRTLAAELVATPLILDPSQRILPTSGYGRNLLHRDPVLGFVVIAMVWPPALTGLAHDHGTWGVVAIADGMVEVSNYEIEPSDPRATRVELRERARVIGGPGATAYVLPPDEDVHRIRNASSTTAAVSIHTYGRDILRCRTFDLTSGQANWVEPRYDSTP